MNTNKSKRKSNQKSINYENIININFKILKKEIPDVIKWSNSLLAYNLSMIILPKKIKNELTDTYGDKLEQFSVGNIDNFKISNSQSGGGIRLNPITELLQWLYSYLFANIFVNFNINF